MIDPDRWNELSPFLDQALDLEEGQKTAWFRDMSAARPDVANELQALLAQISSLDKRGFLEASAVTELSREPLVGAMLIDPRCEGNVNAEWFHPTRRPTS